MKTNPDILSFEERLRTAEANVMNRERNAFIAYNIASDCINPVTGKPLFSHADTTINRFFADTNNEICYDAAMSLEANIIYERVFKCIINAMDRKLIRVQSDYWCNNKYKLKFELGEPDCSGGLSFRGYTMNTAGPISNSYYWNHKEQHRDVTGREFPWPDEALKFFDAYHTPGNFMILPWMQNLDIIREIKCGRHDDYFDLFLLEIYNFFLEKNGHEPAHKYRCHYGLGYDGIELFMTYYLLPFINYDLMRFSDTPCQLIDDIEDGSNLICYVIPGWEAFVECNLLQDFVSTGEYGHYRDPLELWTGHFGKTDSSTGVPKCGDRHIEYWTNATERIKKRSLRIYNKLHGK